MSSGESTERDPLDLLVEQFLTRHRQGEAVDVEAFAAAHPAHAAELRDLLPTLQALEQVKREKESTGGKRARVALPAIARLGDFKIQGELGRGGMGVVFEAVQESLGRKVALKVLPQASLLTGHQLQRFLREAQIAAQLHHSNIVPVFGSGESDGYHWYAMQHIAGRSLDHWRTEQAALPLQGSGAWRARARFVARIGVQAASALHYAHSQGTLHRDVKPGNLLLENNEHLWVTDFGLAKALEAEGLTHSGDLLGTLQYMAPEQFAGHYDARSEVYALGVTLYELLVLRPAFAAKTRSELMERIRTQRPESLRRLCPEVPEDLAIVVERAMARDPADRYASAHAFEQDLQAFLEDRPIAARRQSAFGQVLRWCRHNRGLAALAASTLLAVVGAGIVGWYAYVVTASALGEARTSKTVAEQQSTRADTTLRLALSAFGDVFDGLVGRDPTLALEEDPDTGEQTVIARTVVDPRSVDLLQKMLRFYEQFAAQNAGNQSLRFETARAYRRVGAIHARLGKPESLDLARAKYDQALALLEDVTDRPVAREIAAVHVDYGQLEQRRGRPAEAAQRFQRALTLLENDVGRDSRAAQFERAQAHFLIAQLADPAAATANLRAGGPGGPGSDPRRDGGRRFLDSRKHLQAAIAGVDKLLVEEPENREFRALQARCLLLGANLPAEGAGRDGRRFDRPRDPAAEQDRQRALTILRELVAKYPQAEALRFELCSALVEDRWRDDRRREGPGRSRREPGAAREATKPPTDEELAILREAKGHAETLVKVQPLAREYVALRGRVGTLLGKALRERSEVLAEAEQTAMRREAKAELVAAMAAERGLLEAAEDFDPRGLRDLVDTRRALILLSLSMKERGEAVELAAGCLDLVDRQLTLLEQRKDAGRGGGRSLRPPSFVPELLTGGLLKALGSAEVNERARGLFERFERLLAAAGPERDGGPPDREPPPEGRRGGK